MLSSLAGALPMRQRQGSDAFSTGSIEKDREANLVTPTPNAVPDRTGNSRTPRPGLNGLHAANEVAREVAYEDDGDEDDVNGRSAMRRNLADSDLDPRLAQGAFTGGSGSRSRLASTSAYGDQRRTSVAISEGGREGAEPGMYASDSLGRGSIASSAGYSDFGNGHRGSRPSGWSAYEGSEAGDDRQGSVTTQNWSNTDSSRTRKKRLAPPETLVIVRPPPSKQSNPLNLQIQLVAPVAAPSNARSSGDYSRDDASSHGGSRASPTGNIGLRRSPSTMSHHSERSDVSASSSAASASSARRVTPLYNLNFHTLLPTTVTDAGTDQKVARFARKGIDLDGFGLLEPHELLRGLNDLATLEQVGGVEAMKSGVLPNSAKALSLLSSGDSVVSGNVGRGGPASITDSASLASSTAVSRASDHDAIIPSVVQPPTSFEAMTPEAQAAPVEQTVGTKLLGRFKRMSFGGPPKSNSNSLASSVASSNGFGGKLGSIASSKRASMDGSMLSATSTRDTMSLASEVPQLVAGAGLSSDGTRKTQGYYWVIRKWARQVPEEGEARSGHGADGLVGPDGQNTVLSNVWKRFNMVNRMGGFERHPPAKDIPIRFEWTKDSRDSSSAIARRRKNLLATPSATSLRRQAGGHGRFATDSSTSAGPIPRAPQAFRGSFDIAAAVGGPKSPSSEPRELSPTGSPDGSAVAGPTAGRPSTALGVPKPAALTASPRRSLDVGGGGSATGSPSSESRVIRRGSAPEGSEAGGDGGNSDPEDSETTWSCHLVLGPTTRIPIGSLSPAPHHPKVVGQLQIPFPLPDLSATGLGADGAGLTREELKDIVSVSCLFLVIREGFGGLAKKRKGDAGWKLGVAQLGQA